LVASGDRGGRAYCAQECHVGLLSRILHRGAM
jgi:hypothetical protein